MQKINLNVRELDLKTINQYNELARRKKIALVFKNTKGLTKEKVELLSDNITISILGGLNPVKRNLLRKIIKKELIILNGKCQKFQMFWKRLNV